MAKALPKPQLSPTEERLQAIYGPTMLVDELADVLGYTVESIYTLRSIGKFPITLFRPGGRKLLAYTADVASHLDTRHAVQLREDAALLDLLHN